MSRRTNCLSSNSSRERMFLTADFTSLTASSLKLLQDVDATSPSNRRRSNTCLGESSLQLVSKSATDFMSVKRRASRAAVGFSSGIAASTRYGWAGSDGGKGRLTVSKERRPDSVLSFASSSVSSRKKIEEMLNLDHMQELRKRFEEADADGNGALDVYEFKAVFKKLLGSKAKESSSEEQMTALFMKIDSSSDGLIDWDEFCTYMLLEFSEKDDAYHRSIEVLFNLPAVSAFTPHRDTIFRVCHQNDSTFVTASQDGMLAFWSTDLSLKRTFQLPKVTSRGTDAGSQATEASSRGNDTSSRPKKRWVTDVALLTHFNKFVISTGDRELQFYELSTLEPYCHISSLESIPLKLHFWADPSNKNYCLLSFGDGEGCVSTFIFYNISSCFRQWKKFPRADQTPSVTLDQVANSPDSKLVRWKVHDDWVAELKYFHAIRSVISCAHDPNTAVVVGSVEGSTHVESYLRELSHSPVGRRLNYAQQKHRYDADQTVFRIYKGAKTFDFSAEHNILATGGMDRVLRLWNPYVASKPIAMLRGHSGPIMKLAICESESRVYTISTDKTVKVWHIQDQSCLTTITEKAHKVAGSLQTMHYNPGCRTLAIVTDVVAVLTLKGKPVVKERVLSHRDPVQSVKYNSSFKQVLTCCDGSVVKLWELETGIQLFEFSHAHDDEPIVDMVFDSTQRRLITAGQDGTIRSWNFNNGHCLRVFKKDNKQEFTSLTYVNFNNCKRVIGVGWDRRLTMFPDMADDCHHVQYPLPYWPDDLNFGHQEDILASTFCPPHYVATSSFDGEIIIWSLASGHIFSRLLPPKPSAAVSYNPLEGDAAVSCLVFLETRSEKQNSASLIANGPKGIIHFWQMFKRKLMGSFSASRRGGVSAMATIANNTFLFTGDHYGFMSVWDIRTYCLVKPSSKSPQLAAKWRAHIDNITCIEYVEEHELLLTSCVDCCVRLWTVDGQYIGTFGQPHKWNIHDSSTFEHPMIPHDVLMDPSIPGCKTESSSPPPPDTVTVEVEENVANEQEQDMLVDEVFSTACSTPSLPPVDSTKTHLSSVLRRPYTVHSTDLSGHGKRLRQEKYKPRPQDRGGLPNYYRSLSYFDVDSVQSPGQPAILSGTARRDRFDDL